MSQKNMNRRSFVELCALTAGASLASLATGCTAKEEEQPAAVSEDTTAKDGAASGDELIASLILMSDTHLSLDNEDRANRFKTALSYLAGFSTRPDAIVINGDIANSASPAEYEQMQALIEESAFSLKDDFIMVCGNHDQYTSDDNAGEDVFKELHDQFVSYCGTPSLYYDRMVAGQHVIALGPDALASRWDRFIFSSEQLTWLEGLLKQDAEQDINSFVILHEPIPGTVYGAMEGNWGYTASMEEYDELKRIVEGYPRVVVVSAHTHIGPVVTTTEECSTVYVTDGSVGFSFDGVTYDRDHIGSTAAAVRVYANRLEFDGLDFLEQKLTENIAVVEWEA